MAVKSDHGLSFAGGKLGPWSEFPFLYRFTVLLNSGCSNSPWSEFWSEFLVPAPSTMFVLISCFVHSSCLDFVKHARDFDECQCDEIRNQSLATVAMRSMATIPPPGKRAETTKDNCHFGAERGVRRCFHVCKFPIVKLVFEGEAIPGREFRQVVQLP